MNHFLKVSALFFILSYGMFYYAYKFSSPDIQGLKDYESYAKLYKSWDYHNVESPFNSRILSSFGIYLLCKTGFSYDTDIVFTNDDEAKVLFFNGLLFNYLFIVLTGVLIYYFCWYQGIKPNAAMIGGLIYIFSFSTIFFYLTPLTEAFSGFIAVLIFISFHRKNNWYLVLFVLAIFQREYILFLFGLIAAFYGFTEKENRKYYFIALIASIICFAIYFSLRKTLFYTPDHNEQLNISEIVGNLFKPTVSFADYFKQAFLTQNLFVLYLILVVYKSINRIPIDNNKLILILLLFIQMIIISFLGKLAQTIGRLFFLAAPLIIYFLLFEAQPIFQRLENRKQ